MDKFELLVWLADNDPDVATYTITQVDAFGYSVMRRDVRIEAMKILDFIYNPLEYLWGEHE